MAMFKNTEREFERNRERYAFLRWGQTAFDSFSVVPNTGIVHQVKPRVPRAWLSRAIRTGARSRSRTRSSDGLAHDDDRRARRPRDGASAGSRRRPCSSASRSRCSSRASSASGFRASCRRATATDLVLSVTQILRAAGVVGKFVEYFGHGLVGLPLADRATIGSMSPEYGATCGFFPVDEETLRYMRLTGRAPSRSSWWRLLPRAGPLPRPRPHARVLAGDRARPRRRRAEPRRAAPPQDQCR